MRKIALAIISMGLLGCSMAVQAVVVGAYDWRQLTETTGFSWDQVATVCDPGTGACAGSLGTVSFDGWTWADNTAIQGLFEQLILPGSIQFPSSTSAWTSLDSADIDAAIAPTAFYATETTSFGELLRGISRTSPSGATWAYMPFLYNRPAGSMAPDVANLVDSLALGDRGRSIGMWLFRPAQRAVPEPGPLALFVVGIAGLVVMWRQRASGETKLGATTQGVGVWGWL